MYDGAGRATHQFVSFDLDETTWSEALEVNGDTVIEQSQSIYDPGSRVVAGLSFQRFEDDTTTTGPLDGTNSYRNASVTWYDVGNRVTHSATFGRDDGPSDRYVFALSDDSIIDANGNGIPDEAEGPPREPGTSHDYIVSKTQYDSAGRGYRTIDNLGRVTQTDFDLLGRTVRMIQNYVDGIATETETDTDVTVEYDYDAAGRMVTLRAKNPKGTGNGVENQETRYLHESPINASWVTNEIYPDSSDVDSTGTDQIKFTHDRLGRQVTRTDQRGVEHTYSFDAAGRAFSDAVTVLPAGVDDAVLRIERTYDDMSRVATITSYNAPSGGNVVNQVAYEYNGYGLASVVRQGHDGPVDANTPKVTYNYDDGATGGEAQYLRLASVEYPDGRLVHYVYPTSGVGAVLSRVEAIADDPDVLGGGLPTVTLAEYSYLGTSTIVEVRHPDVNGGLTLSYNATGNYEGWDRFGRVVNQQWTDGAGTTTFDRYGYTYDRNSNRESRSNVLNTALSESYGYDGLDRLVDANRAGSDFQDWMLDGLGNWNDFTDQGTTETRTHNAANEISDIDTSGVIDPVYDAAGNMTSGPRPDDPIQRQHYMWDAWNRLVEVLDDDSGNPGTTIAEFEYDGRNYRIQKTAGGVLQAFFHNENHQVLEVRKDGDPDPSEQYVWDLRYIDALVVRFHDADSDGVVDDIHYYANDANMNVTALIDSQTGMVVKRFHYAPYGAVVVYDGVWTSLPASFYDNTYLYAGRHLDNGIMHYYLRARYYDGHIGRFLNRDPMDYGDGLSLYQYTGSKPLSYLDPTGLRKAAPTFTYVPGVATIKVRKPPQGTGDVESLRTEFSLIAKITPKGLDDGKGCPLCTEIGWVQIYKEDIQFGHSYIGYWEASYMLRTNYLWTIDAPVPYGNISAKYVKVIGPVIYGEYNMKTGTTLPFYDKPGALAININPFFGSHGIQYMRQDFEVHLMCLEGPDQFATYGGYRWGHAFRVKDKSRPAHFLTEFSVRRWHTLITTPSHKFKWVVLEHLFPSISD